MREKNVFFVNLFQPSKAKRILFFLLFDVLIIVFGFYLAVLLRFEFLFPKAYADKFFVWALGLIVIRVFFLSLMGLYSINWRFVGIVDLKNVIKALFIAFLVIYLFNYLLGHRESSFYLSRGVLLIEVIVSFSLICFLRISKRLFFSFCRGANGIATMVVGASGLGERLIMEMISEKEEPLYPMVIIDNDENKEKTRIHGIPVLSGYHKIQEAIKQYGIKTVLINLKSNERKGVQEIFDSVSKAGVHDVRVVPSINEFGNDIFRSKSFKQLAIEDLLSRDPVEIEDDGVKDFLFGKSVLVTGAAGSIGSELVRKLIEFGAGKVVGYEIDETEIFDFNRELSSVKNEHGTEISFVLGDIRDIDKLNDTFQKFKPDIVFHASAYKHVPILEDFPEEGVKTNVFGTYNLAFCAQRHGCRRVVNISTDKAVNPTSVMGATKRVAELICRVKNSERTSMISVRFGNVLGSRGSVIPIFLDQIKKGGPVTVTHKDMKRYFMSIPEAVLLVLQASFMGIGGEVFVLDMGEPVEILSLARNLIKMNGLIPGKDIEIAYSGLRPGEKLFEELLSAEEGVNSTSHKKVFIAKLRDAMSIEELEKMMSALKSNFSCPQDLVSLLKKYVPFYKSA